MRALCLCLNLLAPLPAQAAYDDVEPIVVTCTFGARVISLSPWGWAGVHWHEAGEVSEAGFARSSGFDGPIISVDLYGDDTATILTYDLRRRAPNAVMAFTFATDASLASGQLEGQCEGVK